jgi:BirA family biotin operon repressor/biotin-[acetyl-CoA-carboxylase] ligase
MMALAFACYNSSVSTRKQILNILSDGQFHSGTEIGDRLGISRAAVNKAINTLAQGGMEIHRVSGRGYRLAEPQRPIDRDEILKYLASGPGEYEERLHVFDEIDSTSNFLIALGSDTRYRGAVAVTEAQTGGRGRRGRTWVATPYSNIMMSMSWRYEAGPAAVAGLSLAAGVAIIESLEEFGVTGTGLKWPNDVLWQDRKLAGLLLDVQGEANGPTRVVLGLGVNVQVGEEDGRQIDQPWVDLHSIVDDVIDRNRLAAILIKRLEQMFADFASTGLAGFLPRWQQAHLYHGQAVRILRGDDELEGIVTGIDETGAIQVRDESGHIRAFHSGEISLRAGTRAPAN